MSFQKHLSPPIPGTPTMSFEKTSGSIRNFMKGEQALFCERLLPIRHQLWILWCTGRVWEAMSPVSRKTAGLCLLGGPVELGHQPLLPLTHLVATRHAGKEPCLEGISSANSTPNPTMRSWNTFWASIVLFSNMGDWQRWSKSPHQVLLVFKCLSNHSWIHGELKVLRLSSGLTRVS